MWRVFRGSRLGEEANATRCTVSIIHTVSVMQGGDEADAVPAGTLAGSPEPTEAITDSPPKSGQADALASSPEPADAVTGDPQQASSTNIAAVIPEPTEVDGGGHEHVQSELPASPSPPGHAALESTADATHTVELLEVPSSATPHTCSIHVPHACCDTAGYMHVRRLLSHGGGTVRRHLRQSKAAWAPLAVPLAVLAVAVAIQVVTTAREYAAVRPCYADYQGAPESTVPAVRTCGHHRLPP